MKQVNWGIIGLGAIATQFTKGFKDVSNAKLLGIASKHLEKLNKFKEEFKIDNNYCFDSYEELIDNKDIDIIYIALPTSLHYEWIVKCIDRGKKVLVEKPATMNAVEIKAIKKKYINKEIFLNEAFMYMYHPQIKKTVELINQEEIGELISMESKFGNDILSKKNFFGFKKIKKANPKNRIFNEKLGGGVILDLGSYPVSLSSLIASQISKIDYDDVKLININKDKRSNEVEINASMELIFENNFKSKVSASFTKNLGTGTHIIGTKGEIIIEDTWSATPPTIILKKDKNRIFNINSRENIYSYEINILSQCILDNKTKLGFPSLTIDDIIGNMKILDQWKN